jgi:hypothetical protein
VPGWMRETEKQMAERWKELLAGIDPLPIARKA